MAAFVNEGKITDVFGPGLYTLNTQTLPLLTKLMNWDKMFQSPFKSDVYFFSTRTQVNQKWGTPNPITIRDKDFGAVRLRAFGIYSWHLSDPKNFHTKISGTRETYRVEEIEAQLRNTIVAHMSDAFAQSHIPFLDMASNQLMMGQKIQDALKPYFAEIGISLDTFVVENLSLPEELQKHLDERISMNMIGDMRQYTQYQVAQSVPLAAENPGGLGALGASLGVGFAMSGAVTEAMRQPQGPTPPGNNPIQPGPGGVPPAPPPAETGSTPAPSPAAAPPKDAKICIECGQSMPVKAKFC